MNIKAYRSVILRIIRRFVSIQTVCDIFHRQVFIPGLSIFYLLKRPDACHLFIAVYVCGSHLHLRFLQIDISLCEDYTGGSSLLEIPFVGNSISGCLIVIADGNFRNSLIQDEGTCFSYRRCISILVGHIQRYLVGSVFIERKTVKVFSRIGIIYRILYTLLRIAHFSDRYKIISTLRQGDRRFIPVMGDSEDCIFGDKISLLDVYL